MMPLLLGTGFGAGLWLLWRGLHPRPEPLDLAFARLSRPAAAPVSDSLLERLAVRVIGDRARVLTTDLRLVGRTPARHALDKLVGLVGGFVGPMLVLTALQLLGVGASITSSLVLSIGTAIFGFMLPDLSVRDQARARRAAFMHSLSSYFDLVNVVMAAGGGGEMAMFAAAETGEGWAWELIRSALNRARTLSMEPWDLLDELAHELNVPELAEFAATVSLAGEYGASIRSSIAAKADSLRSRQIADTETRAEKATEAMTIPVAVLLFGFLVFIAWPAVNALSTAGAGPVP